MLGSHEGVFVLFYAGWCPFSLAFLPVYEKHAAADDGTFVRMMPEGNEELFDEYGVEVYPTVIYFKAGKAHKRLDGKHLVGLKEDQLAALIAACSAAD
jgi:thioredoxin-like negative regulator of GroEL